MSWRIAFLGTFHPAVPTLRELAERNWVNIIVLPENASEKNNALIEIAEKHSVPWTYELTDIERYDINLILAANYPKLVPSGYLQAYPCINTHWSLLPNYRGVHPTAWALLNFDYDVGFTIHWMKEDFDTGDVLAQSTVRMRPDMDIVQLHMELAERQAEAVIELLEDYLKTRRWDGKSQQDVKAIYVPKRVPEDGIIDWEWPTERIWNLVRALPSPLYPGAFTFLQDNKLIVWRAKPVECPPYFATPGQVVRVIKDRGVWVKTGDTCLELLEVEFEDDDHGVQRADRVLRLGYKLGFNPQLEIARLNREVAAMVREIENLRRIARKGHE